MPSVPRTSMVKHLLALVLVLGFGLGACKKKPDESALKGAREAQWRERQKAQAVKYYSDLLKDYPDSPHVEEAKKKRDALGPVATPVKK